VLLPRAWLINNNARLISNMISMMHLNNTPKKIVVQQYYTKIDGVLLQQHLCVFLCKWATYEEKISIAYKLLVRPHHQAHWMLIHLLLQCTFCTKYQKVEVHIDPGFKIQANFELRVRNSYIKGRNIGVSSGNAKL